MRKTYNNYTEGDYAKYTGDMTIKSGILRDATVGTIEKFEKFNEKVRILFKPIDSEQSMWVDFDNLREIDLEWKHLEAMGFEKIEVRKDKYKYYKDGITISDMMLSSIPLNGRQEHFLTRLCIADFEKFDDRMIKPFIKGGYFNQSLFFEKYPSVYNLNRLVEELSILGINTNIKELAQL